jgi:hypothetical protein
MIWLEKGYGKVEIVPLKSRPHIAAFFLVFGLSAVQSARVYFDVVAVIMALEKLYSGANA